MLPHRCDTLAGSGAAADGRAIRLGDLLAVRLCCRWDRVLLQGQFAQAVGRLARLSLAGGAVQNP
jgi:hypothetical protein